MKVLDQRKNLFTFLKSNYDETLSLLIQSRDYFQQQGMVDRSTLDPKDSLAYMMVMSTITSQLTGVFSWLLVCKALQDGEITLEDAVREEFRLLEIDTILDENDPVYSMLNEQVAHLLRESTRLYLRIQRIENSFVQSIAA